MKKLLALLTAGLMVMIIIAGCTEDPWEPEPSRPLDLFIVSAPGDSTDVPAYSTVNFTWAANGGSGDIEYRWSLVLADSAADYNDYNDFTSAMYDSVGDVDTTNYEFSVMARDEDGNTDTETTTFMVSPYSAPPADVDTPTVEITMSPAAGAYVAVGSNISFAWEGDDGNSNDDQLLYQYAFPTAADTINTWVQSTAVSFSNVAAIVNAGFYIRVKDQAGNMSGWVSVLFVIQNANILYIDDYQFHDDWGDVDNVKERDQKQFYRDALEGYAFAEWDNDVQGTPTIGDLAGFDVVIWCADSEIGSADPSYRLWFDVGVLGGGVLKDFMDGGGKLLITGSEVLNYVNNSVPPSAGDFESQYLGVADYDATPSEIDTTWWLDEEQYDTLVVTPDSVIVDTTWEDPWATEWTFTWAVKHPDTPFDLPDSMKIDVAKQADQDDYATGIFYFRDDATVTTEPLYAWGLWVDGSAPDPPYYGSTVGHITYWSSNAVSAMLNFDTYSMPPTAIRQTFQTILTEFGE